MSHAEAAAALRARLVDGIEPEVRALRRLDPRKRALDVGVFAGFWAAGIAIGLWGLGSGSWLLRVAGILLSAVALNAFMLLMHEGMHGLLSRNPRANRWGSVLVAAPLLFSATAYRVLHNRHHRHLGEKGDPDDYHNYSENPRVVWALHWMRLTIGPPLYLLLIPAMALRHGDARERRHVLEEHAALGALWASAFLLVPLPWLVQGWLAPAVVVGYFTSVRGLAQHGFTDRADPAAASRTVRANRLVAFLMLYENYHLEHHLFPDVPSYHLPRLHALVWPRLPRAVSSDSYLQFMRHFLQRNLTLDESPLGLEVRGS